MNLVGNASFLMFHLYRHSVACLCGICH